ncbi:MAG: phage tail tape measure protein [Planctomycetes bacterium]|nr:phage tail tape measure protein [Planctomycetota bacterium]
MAENVDLATLAIRVNADGVEPATKKLEDLAGQASDTEGKTDRLGESTTRLVAKYVSLAAIAATVGQAFRFSIGQYTTLEAATANLAAKTGLAGDSLAVMVSRAKELSGATTQSAAAILDAAEQVEGLVPRLAGNAEAISEVTRQAVILAEATGDELQPSVAAVGQALAQFGGGAGDAARYANALVAAAQNGAAEVQDLAGSMERVGPAAARAGISFEQTLAAMELLANRGIRGREAVGGLKEFLDSLATSTTREYNPALVGLDSALEALAGKNLTAAERTKLFGEAAADVAAVLIGSQAEVAALTDDITGTSAAAEQATERLKTFEAQSKILANEVSNLGAEIGGAVVPYLVSMAREAAGVARALRDITAESGPAEEGTDAFAGVLRAGAVAALAFTNTLGLAVRTAENLVSILPRALTALSNPIESSLAIGAITKQIGDDYEATVRRIEAVRERLTTPDAVPDVLTRPAAPGAGDGDADAAAKAAQEAEERAAAARREAAAAALIEAQEAEEKRLEFLEEIRDKAFESLNESTNAELDLQAEANQAKYQAEVDLAQRIEDFRLEHQEQLAERMKEWFETDLERTLEDYQRREDAVNEFYEGVTFPNEEERLERLRKLYEEKDAAITELFRRGAFTRAQFAVASTKNQAQGVLGELENMTRGIAQHNKTAFQINKAAAIAQALIDMPEHVSKTMAKYPYPLSIGMGALAAAQSLAQVNAIRSATFEGGGGGTTPSLAGSGGVVNGNPAVPDAAPTTDVGSARGQGSQIVIAVTGNQVFDDYALDRLVDRIGDIVNDGDRTIFRGDSRQAQDIVVTTR